MRLRPWGPNGALLCIDLAIMFKLNLTGIASSLRTGSRPRKKGAVIPPPQS
jgi:hypothetical protein